jgi:hypothetical protein
MANFLAMGDLLAVEAPLEPHSKVLFDWSEITSWDLQPPVAANLGEWLADANGAFNSGDLIETGGDGLA